MTRTAWVTVGLMVIVAAITILPAFCQQGDQQGGPPPGMGPGGGPGGPMGQPPMAPPVVVVADGVVYVAADGKLTAYEAKTLRKLAEATYATRDASKRGGHGAGGENAAPAGPPAN